MDAVLIAVDPEVLKLLPKSSAVELRVLPLRIEQNEVVVALAEDFAQHQVEDLEFLFGKRVKVEKVSSQILDEALQLHYGASSMELKPRMDQPAEFVSLGDEETKVEAVSNGSVVGLANRIISDAIQMGASDIHVEPYERTMRVRYRIDGVLHEVQRPSADKIKPLISRLKIMADLDIAEKRRPQDGRIRVREGSRTIDIRVSSLPTDFGEKVVLRILDKSRVELDLSKLGFESEDLRQFERAIRLPYGMILVTGPTGSGKTTTLYAALSSINRPEVNITTIEDPIEYNLHGINQTHVRADIGVTFAAALRSILRQDPNVIMVGEIRDRETAEIAIRAALTGHLVLSTLHTNDAPSAITRLTDMGIEPFLVASSVKMILAQRLLRRLCENCKSEITLTPTLREELALRKENEGQFYAGRGCPSCNQYGYKGRTAVYEILPISNGLVDRIAKGIPASEVREMGRKSGMVTLREAALRKAWRGETSAEEVLRETSI